MAGSFAFAETFVGNVCESLDACVAVRYYLDMTTTTATTALGQLTRQTVMQLGLHEFLTMPNGFQAKIGGRAKTYLIVTLNARDLYDVEIVRVARNYDRVAVLAFSDIYADTMNKLLQDAELRGFKAAR